VRCAQNDPCALIDHRNTARRPHALHTQESEEDKQIMIMLITYMVSIYSTFWFFVLGRMGSNELI